MLSTRTTDSIARKDIATWKELRRELEDFGISSLVISEKRQFIITWIQEAVAAGKFKEESPVDDIVSDQDSLGDESDDTGQILQGDHGEYISQIDANDGSHNRSSPALVAQPKQRNDSTDQILPHIQGSPKHSDNKSIEAIEILKDDLHLARTSSKSRQHRTMPKH